MPSFLENINHSHHQWHSKTQQPTNSHHQWHSKTQQPTNSHHQWHSKTQQPTNFTGYLPAQ
jgi:hypothetical protein